MSEIFQGKHGLVANLHFFLVSCLLCFLCFLFIAECLEAASVTVAWDRSPGTNVAGYNIYEGIASRSYTNKLNVGNSTNGTVSGLVQGTNYFFAVTAYDTSGLESDYSNELAYRVPAPKSNYLTVGVRVLTAGSLLGPWALLTNVAVLSQTNPAGAQYFKGELTITNSVR